MTYVVGGCHFLAAFPSIIDVPSKIGNKDRNWCPGVILLVMLILGLFFSYSNWFIGTNPTEPWTFPGLLIGLLITIPILGIIIRVVFAIIFGPIHYRRYRRWGWKGPWGQDAEEILDQRYARGEITRDQYQ